MPQGHAFCQLRASHQSKSNQLQAEHLKAAASVLPQPACCSLVLGSLDRDERLAFQALFIQPRRTHAFVLDLFPCIAFSRARRTPLVVAAALLSEKCMQDFVGS